jgi:hypothetical protein
MKMSEARMSVEEGDLPTNFRLKGLLCVDTLLRLMREAVAHYGDLESAVVYLAVVAASAGAATRDPEIRARLAGPVPETELRPISRRAIAYSTGLPRETVRRRIARLVAEGHLIETGKGLRPPHNVLMARSNFAFADALVQELMRAGDRLARL